jgi:3-oxoisoapionate kinase
VRDARLRGSAGSSADRCSTKAKASSPGLLIAFYGDDFTGSTDVMESLARAGLRTVLFLRPPGAAELRRYPGLRAMGVAGTSRTMTPDEMDATLPSVFRALGKTGAPVVHYKVCSTFDSSPQVGSIGRALELGMAEFGSGFVPVVVGAPVLGRYCVFGNLFARSGLGTEPHRLDRHPTMREHPTTPMDEADIRRLLGRQTRVPVGLVDVLGMDGPEAEDQVRAFIAGGVPAVLFDVLNASHLERIGELVWSRTRRGKAQFAVGSSGLEYALLAWWRRCGVLRLAVPESRLRSARSVAVVSGSCSPVTDRQIGKALEAGFDEVALDTVGLVRPRTREEVLSRACEAADALFKAGRSVILHTARGPRDPRLARTGRLLRSEEKRSAEVLGTVLGELLERVMRSAGVVRGAVTGGDTSGFAAQALGLEALEFAAPVAPGAPLCKVHAPGREMDGRELVFKGGQNGPDDFFISLLRGSEVRIGQGRSRTHSRME